MPHVLLLNHNFLGGFLCLWWINIVVINDATHENNAKLMRTTPNIITKKQIIYIAYSLIVFSRPTKNDGTHIIICAKLLIIFSDLSKSLST